MAAKSSTRGGDTKSRNVQMGRCCTLMELSPGVGLMILAHTRPALYPGAHREQLCLGGWGCLQRPSLYPPPLSGLSRGQQSETHTHRGSCRVVLLKLIRHATPAWPTREYSVCVCVCVLHSAVCVCMTRP